MVGLYLYVGNLLGGWVVVWLVGWLSSCVHWSNRSLVRSLCHCLFSHSMIESLLDSLIHALSHLFFIHPGMRALVLSSQWFHVNSLASQLPFTHSFLHLTTWKSFIPLASHRHSCRPFISYNSPCTAGHYMERVAVAILEFAYTINHGFHAEVF